MMPEMLFELRTDVKAILENTITYGIPPDESGRIRFWDLGEAVVAMEKWCWISRFELREAVTLNPSIFSVVDDLIATATGETFPTLPKYVMVHDSPKILFLGAPNSTFQRLLAMEQPRANFVRVVGDPEVAARIAIFHTDFGDGTAEMQPTIVRIDASAASAAGMHVGKTPSLFYIVEQLRPDYCSVFSDAETAFQEATLKVRLNETLYMEHSDQSRIAAEYLFRLKPQPEVEKALAVHLQHRIPAVRRNVAQALGVPSFRSGIDLTLPSPTIEILLEHVSVQPETLMKILGAVKEERDLEVLHWLLCTLSAQFYGGKLKPFVPEVEALTRELDTELGEKICDDTIRLRDALRIVKNGETE